MSLRTPAAPRRGRCCPRSSPRTGEADLRQSSGRAACLIVAQEENRNRCLRSHGHCVRAFVLCCLERHCVEVPVEGGRLVGGVVRGVSGLRSSRRAVLYLGGGVTVRVSLLLGGVIWGISFLSSLNTKDLVGSRTSLSQGPRFSHGWIGPRTSQGPKGHLPRSAPRRLTGNSWTWRWTWSTSTCSQRAHVQKSGK